MRVMVLTNMYPRSDRPTFGIFVKEQIQDLEKIGCDVDVRVIRGDISKRNYLSAIAAVRALAKRNQYDIIHAHYGITGVAALAQSSFPVVVTFHGSDCNGDSPWQTAVSWVVARTAAPIFVSKPLAEGLGLADAPVIPAAVDVDRFKPILREDTRARLGWDPRDVYVLFPGARAELRKRADLFDAVLAEARRERPNIRGVSMENLPRDAVALTMNAVDAVLMTSNYEGSPVAIKEALACCTPVVSVPVGDVPELIDGLPGCGVAGRVPGALAKQLLKAIDSGRSEDLRARVVPFSRERMALEVKRVYDSVVTGRLRRRK
jgi:teichuronic acid biosynthesis glycosyltransferase TuaC